MIESPTKKLVVSCGDFLRTSGIITCLEFDGNSFHLIKEIEINHPIPEIAVKGKGITGMCRGKNGNIWMAFSNVIVSVQLDSGKIVEIITDDRFNDLHDLKMVRGKLVVVNSGNESIDTIDVLDKSIKRFDLLGSDMRRKTPEVSNNSNTKPHLHHVSTITYNNKNEMILGFFKQQRIINVDNWEQIGTMMPSPIHDLQFHNEVLHWTTICGKIFSFSEQTSIFDLSKCSVEIGWTRGLLVSDDSFIIGTTAIRDSNSNFFNVLTNTNINNVGAKVTWFPKESNRDPIHYIFNNSQTRKVYCII